MGMMASHITGVSIVYSTVYSDADQRKHQSSALLAFVRRIHLGPVNSSRKWPVTRKIFPVDDVIMVGMISVDLLIEWQQIFVYTNEPLFLYLFQTQVNISGSSNRFHVVMNSHIRLQTGRKHRPCFI